MDQELVQYLDGRFNDVNERIRHNGVLVEGLRHELHLVADGLLMHIEVRHREDREYFDGKFEGMAALQRPENLERNRPA
jgi:predicted HicB family RNase H-like nuclease